VRFDFDFWTMQLEASFNGGHLSKAEVLLLSSCLVGSGCEVEEEGTETEYCRVESNPECMNPLIGTRRSCRRCRYVWMF